MSRDEGHVLKPVSVPRAGSAAGSTATPRRMFASGTLMNFWLTRRCPSSRARPISPFPGSLAVALDQYRYPLVADPPRGAASAGEPPQAAASSAAATAAAAREARNRAPVSWTVVPRPPSLRQCDLFAGRRGLAEGVRDRGRGRLQPGARSLASGGGARCPGLRCPGGPPPQLERPDSQQLRPLPRPGLSACLPS